MNTGGVPRNLLFSQSLSHAYIVYSFHCTKTRINILLAHSSILRTGTCSWAVVWHAKSNGAVGSVFNSEGGAQSKYDTKDLNYATIMYSPQGNIIHEYGSMGARHWNQLQDWRDQNACPPGGCVDLRPKIDDCTITTSTP